MHVNVMSSNRATLLHLERERKVPPHPPQRRLLRVVDLEGRRFAKRALQRK